MIARILDAAKGVLGVGETDRQKEMTRGRVRRLSTMSPIQRDLRMQGIKLTENKTRGAIRRSRKAALRARLKGSMSSLSSVRKVKSSPTAKELARKGEIDGSRATDSSRQGR